MEVLVKIFSFLSSGDGVLLQDARHLINRTLCGNQELGELCYRSATIVGILDRNAKRRMDVSAQLRWIHWDPDREIRIGSLTISISGDPDIVTAAMRLIQTCNTWMLTTAAGHQDMNQTKRIDLWDFATLISLFWTFWSANAPNWGICPSHYFASVT